MQPTGSSVGDDQVRWSITLNGRLLTKSGQFHTFRFYGWVGVIAAVVVPWRSFQDHPHWTRIRWVPFVSPPVWVGDIIGNILLYVPFGFFAVSVLRRRVWLLGTAAAMSVSCITEMMQVFGHGRFPSVQDVLMNGLGAILGIAVAASRRRGYPRSEIR